MSFDFLNILGSRIGIRARLSSLIAAVVVVGGLALLVFAAATGRLSFLAAIGQTLVLSPSSTTVTVNQTFPITVQVNTNNLNTVVASAEVRYNPADLALESFSPVGDSTSGSVYRYVVEETNNVTAGTFRVTRGAPGDGQTNDTDDGFTGQNGTLVTLIFRALRPVTSTAITINQANSAIVADDRQGTQELDSVSNATVTISGPPAPTISVALNADPSSGTAPLNGVDLTATVSGTATGDIRYRFDCTNDGTYEVDMTTAQNPHTHVDACTYPNVGTFVARVRVDRQGVWAENTTTVTVNPSTPVTVNIDSFAANPSSGTAPLDDVDFTIDISGSATGNIRYRLDCTNNGTYEHDVTNTSDPYTAMDICDYPTAGTYTASVRVDRGGVNATRTTTVTVSAPTTLSVTLTANPSSGTAPLNGVDLTADVSGTATGSIRYRFDCTNNGSFEHDNTNSQDPYTVVDLCDYPAAGTYTASVRVDRGGASATATRTITVASTPTPPPPTPPPPPTVCQPSRNAADYRHVWVRQNGYPTLDWGQSYRFEVTVRNTGNATWCKGIVNLGTDRARDRIPGFVREGGNPSGWVAPNRIELAQNSVAPGQEGTFAFFMTVPRGKTPGTYREYFRLVADGVTWMEDYGIYWDVLVPTLADLYRAGYVSQNGYPTLRRGQSYQFELKLRNTGFKAWQRGIVNLGTDRPRDVVWNWIRQSPDGSPSGWLNNNRVFLVEETVPPGGIGTFRFWYTVPQNKPFGTYRDYFRPVVDGITWMDDWGIYWDVTVVP